VSKDLNVGSRGPACASATRSSAGREHLRDRRDQLHQRAGFPEVHHAGDQIKEAVIRRRSSASPPGWEWVNARCITNSDGTGTACLPSAPISPSRTSWGRAGSRSSSTSAGPGHEQLRRTDLAAGGVPLDFETGIGNTLPVPFRGDVTPKNSGQYGPRCITSRKGSPWTWGSTS